MILTIERYLAGWGEYPAMRNGASLLYHCPFPDHEDNDPSFHVTAGTPYTSGEELWKCFGCGREGGTIFKLIEDFEQVPLWQAYEIAGVPKGEAPQNPKKERRRVPKAGEIEQKVLIFFTIFWHSMLVDKKRGERARLYANRRGIANSTMQKKVFGYAPWDMEGGLAQEAAAAIVGEPTLGWQALDAALRLGIFTRDEKDRSIRFKLQNRLMFHCIDPATGSTLYYQGRSVDDTSRYKIIGPKGIAKFPFWVPGYDSSFSIGAESPFGPACLDRYGIAGFATLGEGIEDEHLLLFPAPIFWGQDGDEAGEKQSTKCIHKCQQLDIPSYRLIPPQFSKKENGIDDLLVRGGYQHMIDQVKSQLVA